jgi:hypothetical protein
MFPKLTYPVVSLNVIVFSGVLMDEFLRYKVPDRSRNPCMYVLFVLFADRSVIQPGKDIYI